MSCSCMLMGLSTVGLCAHVTRLAQLLTEADSCFLSRSYTFMIGVGKGPERWFRLKPLYHKWQNGGLTKWRVLLVSSRAEIKLCISLKAIFFFEIFSNFIYNVLISLLYMSSNSCHNQLLLKKTLKAFS